MRRMLLLAWLVWFIGGVGTGPAPRRPGPGSPASATTSIRAAAPRPARRSPAPSPRTAAGGESTAWIPAGMGAVTVTKSMTISCETGTAGVLVSAGSGINFNGGRDGLPLSQGASTSKGWPRLEPAAASPVSRSTAAASPCRRLLDP